MAVFGHQRQDDVKRDRVQALVKPSGPGGRVPRQAEQTWGAASQGSGRPDTWGSSVRQSHDAQTPQGESRSFRTSKSSQLEVQAVTIRQRDFNLQKIFFTPKKA